MSDLVEANSQAVEKLEEQQRDSTRKKALGLAPDAIDIAEKLMKGHQMKGKQRATPTVMLRAVEVILAQAHGRPEVRDRRTAQAEAGLTIVVNQLTTGEQRVIYGGVPEGESVARGVHTGLEAAAAIAAKANRESQ